MERHLRASKLVETLDLLQRRITERFPDAGLGDVADELTETARLTARRAKGVRRPYVGVRALV
ncbi:MAG: hypothetical protein AAF869_12105 [Pseudomonadota bacterium]